jgi:alanine-glyoxylate transaminase/serine-glyoxylate transaminase/serine-pyruvate transaminase
MLSTESFHSVWITHTETSTGITIPLDRFCSIIRKQAPDTFIIVDAVSSLILENIHMQSFGIDCIFSASQKALASPPGACIIALSKRASEHIQDNVEHNKVQASMVHNLRDLIHASRNYTPAFTPPLPILSALLSSCTQILQDETYQNKLMQQAEKIRNMISQWRGCAINPAFYSNGVSIVHHSQSEKIIESLKQKDIIVAGGQDQWKSKVFRIGHMVLYTDAELQRLNHSMLEILEYIS